MRGPGFEDGVRTCVTIRKQLLYSFETCTRIRPEAEQGCTAARVAFVLRRLRRQSTLPAAVRYPSAPGRSDFVWIWHCDFGNLDSPSKSLAGIQRVYSNSCGAAPHQHYQNRLPRGAGGAAGAAFQD